MDPIASTTGSNRTLTGTTTTGDRLAIHWDEALRRFVAYALDDAPRESLSQPPDPEHAPVFKAVAEILERIEAQPEYIPRRPSLLPKLLATVNDPQAAMVEISRIIAQDPALTGNLLRIANSPMYRVSNQPIESIDRAVTMVGVQGIRSIIATALLQPVMSAGSGTFSKFPELVWEHTLVRSSAAELHAVQVENSEPFVVAAHRTAVWPLGHRGVSHRARPVRGASASESESRQRRAPARNLGRAHRRSHRGRAGSCPNGCRYALESQTLAAELQMENSLGRSLRFGRVAGSVIVLCRLGRLTEAEARAIVLAGEARRRDSNGSGTAYGAIAALGDRKSFA